MYSVAGWWSFMHTIVFQDAKYLTGRGTLSGVEFFLIPQLLEDFVGCQVEDYINSKQNTTNVNTYAECPHIVVENIYTGASEVST